MWASDLTYIPTVEGWLYLCTVMDLHSRRLVGWAISPRMRSDLVVQALSMAVTRRRPPKGLILHSDRGSQYCSRVSRRWTPECESAWRNNFSCRLSRKKEASYAQLQPLRKLVVKRAS